jgi:hypothetical protein
VVAPISPVVVTEPGPNLPIAVLMDLYYQQFNCDLWLMTQLTVRTGQFSDYLYNGSLVIDKYLNAAAVHDNKNVRIDVVRQIKEERRLVVYYFYRYVGEAKISNESLQYFKLELTSRALFAMMQQKRQGALGFEIRVVEVPFSHIK